MGPEAGIQPGDYYYCPVVQVGVKRTGAVAGMGKRDNWKRHSRDEISRLTGRKPRPKIRFLPETTGCVSLCLCK